MFNIHFFEVSPGEQAFLKTYKPIGAAVRLHTEPIEKINLALLRQAEVISPFVWSHISSDVLKKLPKLKLIATRSTGYDHIDLQTCKKRGIAVANVPFYGENTVAEHTFALILALSRKVHQAYFRTIKGDFSLEGLQGFDLKDKTLGIIGTGHIGIHAIRMAKGFGMNVLAYDVVKNNFLAETLGFSYVTFDQLLQKSDIISLHAPYRKETHHMINKGNIKKIKKGAILINTARGALVETEALALALDQGILSGAGLDVLEGEELIKEERQILSKEYPVDHLKTLLQNHILLNRENVVITPHIAFNSREAFHRILETTVNNINAFRSGKPENLVVR